MGFYVEIIHSAAIAVGDAKTPVPTQIERVVMKFELIASRVVKDCGNGYFVADSREYRLVLFI